MLSIVRNVALVDEGVSNCQIRSAKLIFSFGVKLLTECASIQTCTCPVKLEKNNDEDRLSVAQ
jgi:hypothetical protein